MSALRAWLGGLPPVFRWAIYGGALLLGLVVAVSAGWSWVQHREALAQRSLASAAAAANRALGGGDQAALGAAAERLTQFLKDYPRSGVSAEAWYILGNVEFRRGSLDRAAAAFAEAGRRGSPSIAALSLMAQGYVREAKGEPAQALGAYSQALAGRDPRAFLYPDLVLAKARVQEQLKDTAGAIESYKGFLKDVPGSPRAEEVRIRLALLGAGA